MYTTSSKHVLSSYCGLVDARISASDKDLPVSIKILQILKTQFGFSGSKLALLLFSHKNIMVNLLMFLESLFF